MEPKVSIIVPAYNISKYIERCVNSIIEQTYKNLDIIIINDGSTDKTEEICRKLSLSDKRIRFFTKENEGLSSARNLGLKKAKGEYVVFVDGDDAISRDFVGDMMFGIIQNRADIAVCGYKTIFSHRQDLTIPPKGVLTGVDAAIRLLVLQNDYDIIACNKIYRRNLFVDNGIFYPFGQTHEDNLTTYKVYFSAKKVVSVNKPLYLYYKRSGSISTTADCEYRLSVKELSAREAIDYFKNSKKLKAAAEIAYLLSQFAFLDHMIAGDIGGNFKEVAKRIIKKEDRYLKNPYITGKLRLYLFMLKTPASFGYKIFRKIKH